MIMVIMMINYDDSDGDGMAMVNFDHFNDTKHLSVFPF